MGIASRLIGVCLAAGLAAPAVAGDQPVIIKFPHFYPGNDGLPVYSTTGVNPVHYRFDTLTGGPVSAPATAATGATDSASVARVNAPAGRAQASDALYAHVLAEAKARGLR
ncbi:MAG: hypothetical protein VXW58_16585 [Pseudomonadota bacterium]|nr:hypothetical protein [Pseudomonadota bacterium]